MQNTGDDQSSWRGRESLCVLLRWGTTEEILGSEPFELSTHVAERSVGFVFPFLNLLKKKRNRSFHIKFYFLAFGTSYSQKHCQNLVNGVHMCMHHHVTAIYPKLMKVFVFMYTHNGDLCILIHRTKKDVLKTVCLHIIPVDYFQKKVLLPWWEWVLWLMYKLEIVNFTT